MKADLYSIRYEDKAAAILVFRKLKESANDLSIQALGLEKSGTRSRRSRSFYKITAALPKQVGVDLPGILRSVKETLRDHPLFPYLSFDFHITPLTHANWDFDSYDDPNFQKIFIRKRKCWGDE